MSNDGGIPMKTNRLTEHFPNVTLRTQDNQQVRFYDDVIKGKVVVINFIFVACTALCPRATANLAKLQQALGDHAGRDVFIVSISVDPEHDTPAVLKEYAERFHARAGWTFLTGTMADIKLIQRKLGAYPKDGTPHTGMAIYGNESSGSWSATPIITNGAGMARIVLRLVEPTIATGGSPMPNRRGATI
jgi:protein SCO1/2